MANLEARVRTVGLGKIPRAFISQAYGTVLRAAEPWERRASTGGFANHPTRDLNGTHGSAPVPD
jgi:hypothetical protein